MGTWMSNENLSVPAPLFVTWFQCIVTAIICYCAGIVGERHRKSYAALPSSDKDGDDNSFFNQFPKVEYNMLIAKRVFPLSLIFVGMITFNNLCLLGTSTSRNTMFCLGIVIF